MFIETFGKAAVDNSWSIIINDWKGKEYRCFIGNNKSVIWANMMSLYA